MVDAVVSFVVERLGDFLIQEAVFLGRVRNEVAWLKNELGWLQCYIANAEEKQIDNPMIRKWLSDITEIAYDIEDVLDKFIVQVHDDDEDGGTKKIKTVSCFPACIKGKEKVDLYNIGKEVEELKKRINDLSRKRELYGLQEFADKGNRKGNTSSLARLRQLRRATSFSVEERVFGLEDDATRLLAKLFDDDPRRFVISIFGMGGLGKTTLASKLYHNHDVKTKFNRRAWISVSQDYNNHDLLMRIIRSFGITTVRIEELKHMTEEDLERYLHRSLQGQSYLVVIDDVWQKEAWESLKRAFPDDNSGSRVIITTRIKDVAERSDKRIHAHKLRFLRQDESWQLFCERTFGNSNAEVDAELKALGSEMAQKCSGLPLAIVVLGGLLSTKPKPQEWRVVREHIWRNLRNDSIHISYLLALSFNDLSYHLKLCFLYSSIFPEDFEINVEKLMRLWIAEGFIPRDDNRIVEDVANDNFEELINRSLIQTEKRSWGKVVTCRIHDLLRNLAIEKAKELKLFGIYDPVIHSTHDSSILLSCRRQVVYLGAENWLQQLNPNLRSLVFFHSHHGCFSEIIWNIRDMCMKFRFLRVLDLDGFRALEGDRACEQIGNLKHLKYLCLRQSFIKRLPPSILNLRRLQTLDVLSVDTEVELPNEVSKLQDLKHLIGRFSGILPIDSLTTLQSLKYVSSKCWSAIKSEKLFNLRELWIYENFPLQHNELLFVSIAKLKRLQKLSIVPSVSSLPSLQPLSRCSNLTDLRISGKIEELPEDMHAVLPNLECLLLGNSRLRDDPMCLLEKLPCLVMLYLGFRFYSGKKLTCRAEGFPRLELIKLEEDGELEEWQVEEGAMPRLRALYIPEDSKLRIPERLRSMPPPAEWEFEDFVLF